jgi:hypothetical protein
MPATVLGVVADPQRAQADTAQQSCAASDPFTPALAGMLAARWPGQHFSAEVYDERTGCQYELHPSLRLTTASVLKVEVMAGILLRAQSQHRPLSAQERSLILPMITESHDAPTTQLWQSLGGAPGMSSLDNAFGMTQTTQIGPEWGVTVTSARDQVQLLRQVLLGDFGTFGPSYRADALYYMTHVIPSQRWGITAGVPAGWTVANKNGFAGSVCCAWRINSTGVAYDPAGGAYAVAILSDGWPNEPTGIAAVETVNRAIAASLAQPLGPGPSVAVAPNGNQFVFWKGSDGNLWEQMWRGSGWLGPINLGMGPLGSNPSAGVDGLGRTYVFWQGPDRNLWEAFWSGSAWVGPIRFGPAGSQPTVAVGANGNQYVFWKGSDGNLWEQLWRGSGWLGPFSLGMGPLGTAPSAGVDAKGATYVFWRGLDGIVTEGFWNGSAWVGPARMGPVGSQPAVAVQANSSQYVFWRDGDGSLWEQIWFGGDWLQPFSLGMGPLGSAPSVGVDSNGVTYVFWRGVDGVLTEAFWGGSAWVGPVRMGPIG